MKILFIVKYTKLIIQKILNALIGFKFVLQILIYREDIYLVNSL